MCLISIKFCSQRFNVSVRCMLVKKDFLSKLAVKIEASSSNSSLTKEKESFII